VTVPPAFVGAWRRGGLVLDGTRCGDPAEVLWLQTGDWYADIRIPRPPSRGSEDLDNPGADDPAFLHFAEPWAFAGTAEWDPPIMTWHHHLDIHVHPASDANPLVQESGVLVERGTIDWSGRSVAFAEEWYRLTPDNPQTAVEEGSKRIRIAVADWRITVEDTRPSGTFLAVREQRQAGRWQETGRLRPPSETRGRPR